MQNANMQLQLCRPTISLQVQSVLTVLRAHRVHVLWNSNKKLLTTCIFVNFVLVSVCMCSSMLHHCICMMLMLLLSQDSGVGGSESEECVSDGLYAVGVCLSVCVCLYVCVVCINFSV